MLLVFDVQRVQRNLRNRDGVSIGSHDDAVFDAERFRVGLEHAPGHFEYLRAHLLGGFFGRAAADIGGRGGIRAGIKGREIGVGRVHDDIFHAHAQHLGCNLGQHGIGTGADIGCTYQQIERAIVVEFDAGSAHIQTRYSGAMHGKGHTHAMPVAARTAFAALLLPVQFLLNDLQTLWQAATLE